MHQGISQEISQKIKNMSLLCALLVVSIHVSWPQEPLSAGWFLSIAIKEGYARIAVPFFFVVSGFLLAGHFDEEKWWHHEVGKRVRTLVVPFLIWSLVALVTSVPLSIIADLIAHRPFGTSIYILHDSHWLSVFGLDLTDYPMHAPLWYVRCLFLFVVTGALFDRGVRAFRYVWLGGLFLFLLAADNIPIENVREFFRMGYSAAGMFYFSIGVFIRRIGLSGKAPSQVAVLCGVVGFLMVAARLVFVYYGWRGAMMLGKISIPFLIYFTWHFMTARRIPDWLTACSFPIFLMHTVVFPYFAVVLKRLALGELAQAGVMYVGGIVGSIVAAVMLRRFCPKVSSVVFGGR